MVSGIYFALVSGIAARAHLPRYAQAVFEADWHQAYALVADAADGDERQLGASAVARLQALSDALALRDLDEEAEQGYARAQRVCRDAEQLRLVSCRNTGWQAFKRNRTSLARNCFTRIMHDDAASSAERTEAAIALALIDHQLGHQRAAEHAIAQARLSAAQADDPLWAELVELLALDIGIQLSIRWSPGLADHVFWQSVRAAAPASALGSLPQDVAVAASLRGIASGPWSLTLMSRHASYLTELAATAAGDGDAARMLPTRMDALSLPERTVVHAHMRIDSLIAALGGGFSLLTDRLYSTLDKRGDSAGAVRGHLDLLYASGKVAALRGQVASALDLWTVYSQEALHRLRTEVISMRAQDPRADASAQARADDIAGRLPAKYRRAYLYIVENIGHSTLTTREVAAHIDVTERALQMEFKRSLGMSPSALIRQLRLEGVRGELLDDTRTHATVLDTASRWGFTSRSSLLKNYRRQFHESPSETIHG
ncbi:MULTISPECIES: helix-turn-helix transcriptional regulator [Cupriavidus]|jgi:AraC-like DNA-binding protein|uniref:Helix-turn-helix transcriptional regulator n=1 Tax=Cupriavidus pauculus TaxID=82633 RepID=A0A5P2HE07_9BURK|nr:helix-turn-helix transcriptional regulator [Cupriavidus pauculus]QET06527.1 helix-turn-helix transcriptional regulator [Cupriavidus pauculus]